MSTYAVQCTQGTDSAVLEIDGVETMLACGEVESTSHSFIASNIKPVSDPASYRLLRVNRYQF